MTRESTRQDEGEHPDELLLAGFAEGRLLEFERSGVEEHLVDCRACRELAATLARDANPILSRESAREEPPRPRLRLIRAMIVAAAVFLIALLILRERSLDEGGPLFELALGDARETLFSPLRDATPAGDELYVGLRLEAEAWVRLVAVDERGGTSDIPLDPEGRMTARFESGIDQTFGPYPRSFGVRGERELVAIVALVSRVRIEAPDLRAGGWEGELDRVSLELLARRVDARVISRTVR